MRIVIAIGTTQVGGAELQFVRLARELALLNNDVRLVFLKNAKKSETVHGYESVRHTQLNMHQKLLGFQLIRGAFRFVRLLHQTDPQVVIAVLPNTIAFTLPLVKLFFRSALRVAAIRGSTLNQSWVGSALFRMGVQRADVVTCNSPHLCEEIQVTLDLKVEGMHVIPNGVNIPVQPNAVRWPPKRAITVANFIEYKGHSELLYALVKSQTDIELVLCGRGELQTNLEQLVVSLGLENRVHFINDADIEQELQKADFMIHPSKSEGLSNAILEGLAHGLPVLALNIPGNRNLICDGVNGLLVEPGSVEGMGQAISSMTKDFDDFELQVSAARRVALDYSWAKCGTTYLETLQEALDKRNVS